eukprot:scaffold3498_cov176-Amphora_coffeaeformis.AAC.11
MQEDFNGFRIGSHDNELGNTAIERFGGFVGPLFDLETKSTTHQTGRRKTDSMAIRCRSGDTV